MDFSIFLNYIYYTCVKAYNVITEENKKIIIECKKRYFRPLEVDYLRGNARKAKKILKWFPKISIDDLIDDMIKHELKNNYDQYQ